MLFFCRSEKFVYLNENNQFFKFREKHFLTFLIHRFVHRLLLSEIAESLRN